MSNLFWNDAPQTRSNGFSDADLAYIAQSKAEVTHLMQACETRCDPFDLTNMFNSIKARLFSTNINAHIETVEQACADAEALVRQWHAEDLVKNAPKKVRATKQVSPEYVEAHAAWKKAIADFSTLETLWKAHIKTLHDKMIELKGL